MIEIMADGTKTQRVLIWSGDAQAGGSLQSYTIILPFPITNCVKLEWLSTSIPGYLLSIEPAWNESTSSNGRRYWRFLDAFSNQRYSELASSLVSDISPQTLRYLAISLWNPDGTAATITANHTIELEAITLPYSR